MEINCSKGVGAGVKQNGLLNLIVKVYVKFACSKNALCIFRVKIRAKMIILNGFGA